MGVIGPQHMLDSQPYFPSIMVHIKDIASLLSTKLPSPDVDDWKSERRRLDYGAAAVSDHCGRDIHQTKKICPWHVFHRL
jgi:hypothetical protein